MHSSNFSNPARPLLRLDLDASLFGQDWRHCDRVANYLAKLASFDRTDAFLYGNLFSTVLNELFEIVFMQHKAPGTVICSLLRSQNGADRIVLEIPADDPQCDFYERSVALAQAPDAGETYTRSVLGNASPDRAIGFLELAADYGASIRLQTHRAAATVNLIVEVRLEDRPPDHPSPSPSPFQ